MDLSVLCRAGLTLDTAFDLFERKFGTARTDRYHRLRALPYFDEAERERPSVGFRRYRVDLHPQ